MNMQLPHDAFDRMDAHPLARSQPPRAGSRIGAVLITLAAHIAVVAALIAGISTTRITHKPAVIEVHIDQEQKKPDDLPPPLQPVLARPTVISVPVPVVAIAPPPSPIIAALSAPPPPPPSVTQAPNAAPAPVYSRPTWQSMLLARLEQAKRYPAAAQARAQQGVALLHFTMDRDGKVLSANIQKSSGYDMLDAETLALIQRAQPLPRPPAEVTGNTIELVVPVEFYLNRHR